jgi:hypothetical protein
MSNVYDGTGNAVWMVAVFLGLAGLFGVFSFFCLHILIIKRFIAYHLFLVLVPSELPLSKFLDIVNSFDAKLILHRRICCA